MTPPRPRPGPRPAAASSAAGPRPSDGNARVTPRGPRWPRSPGVVRPAAAKGGLPFIARLTASNLAYFCALAVIPAHLLFAVEAHSTQVRLMTAVPAVVLILETRRYLEDEAGELPFLVLALLQYYVAFGFGVFFDLKFYDLSGPVNFSEDARNLGAAAVALGAISLWAGARLGRVVATGLQPWFVRLMPSAQLPEQADKAVYIYAAATIFFSVVILFFPSAVPSAFGQIVVIGFSVPLAIGFAIVRPPRALGTRLPQLLAAITMALSMLSGSLDTLFRAAIGYVAGRWAAVREVSIRVAAAVVVLYAVTQPVKGAFREKVWFNVRPGETVGVAERVSAWNNAYSGYFDDHSTQSEEGGMSRMSELGAVMHAFDMVPSRVSYLDGSGLAPALYSPIPRLLWANKPTTNETVQRYAVIFGRQTEMGARSTAINLPLLVEGYWNFGWPGVAFVCIALGLWLGMSQRMLCGDHWAMRATGIANITGISVASSVVLTYSGLFQLITGRVAICWAVFWLATLLSRRRFERPAHMVRQPALRR